MARKERLDSASGGPKYMRIYQSLRETLENGTYSNGAKLPSESELVGSFGASRPTVRRALELLTTEGLIQRRMGAGTVASQAAPKLHLVFGLLIPELGMTEIFEPICQGISQAQVGGHHELLWGPTLTGENRSGIQAEHLSRYYIDRKVSGVFFAPVELIEGGDEVNLAIAQAFDQAQIPVILLDRDIATFPQRSKYDVVGIDNHRAGYMLTAHLLQTGSRRIAFLARPHSAHTVNARIGGYQLALLDSCDNSIQPIVKWANPQDIDAIRTWMEEETPDTILCANDFTAAQLLGTLNALNYRVPGQIRVAGIDDVKYAQLLQTPLTTIHQPCKEIGAMALQAMLNRIANPAAPARDYLVDFQLKIRQSTATQLPLGGNQHLSSDTGPA